MTLANNEYISPARQRKAKQIEEIKSLAESSSCLIVAKNNGMTVKQFEQLRNSVRNEGVNVGVHRNTLAGIAVKDTQFEAVSALLKGPTLLMFSEGEIGPLAKLVDSFMKDKANQEKFDVLAISAENACHSGDQLKAFASLPSRSEALSMLLGTLQAPVSQFVRVTKEPVVKMVRTVKAVADKNNETN